MTTKLLLGRAAIGAVLLLAFVAAGCGGGGSKTLSKDEYRRRLNSICADYNATVARVGRPTNLAQLASEGPRLIAEFDKTLLKIKQLEPPSEVKLDAEKLVSESKQLRDLVNQIVAAAKKKDAAKITQLGARAGALSKDSDALARRLGAPACAAG
jgi:hypothetical protein